MKTSLRLQFALASAFLLTLSSCASRKSELTQTASTVQAGGSVSGSVENTDALDDYGGDEAEDPFEKLNRITFEFNEDVYRFVVRPISKGCTTLTPKPVRKGIDNVFDNLRFPGRVVNSSLQGKMGLAGKEVQEFGMNTVLGVGGLFKASDKVPSLVDLPEEDALQTLAVWGFGQGSYAVLPIIGPSTLRDGLGLTGDTALNPISWLFLAGGSVADLRWIPATTNTVRLMPSQLELYDQATANSVDPYLSVKSIYLQSRKLLEAQ
jgi:phospholipid-binding lipoprotein MlaA